MRLRALLALALALFGCSRPPAPPPAGETAPAPAASVEAGPEPADASPDAAPDAGADAAAPRAHEKREIDRAKLDTLVADAKDNGSDALVVLQDGNVVGEWYFDQPKGPIQTMSITKSVLSLAIGTLVDAGKLRLDQPIFELYPEWAKDERRGITLRHLLTHSSGLEEGKSTLPIYRSDDFVRFTLHTKLAHPPGTHFEYSNRAANLLAGIVSKVSRMPADRYVQKTLLEPLGIRETWWSKDKTKQAHGMAGLHVLPRDLAKIGELVLANGDWHGRRIVSASWISLTTRELAPVQPPNKRLGLLWWLVPEWTERVIDDSVLSAWRAAGVDEAFIAKVNPLVGRRFQSTRELTQALGAAFDDPTLSLWNETTWKRDLPDVHFTFGPLEGVYSSGTLGQWLVVLPLHRVVVVRMRRSPKQAKDKEDATRTFPDFVERVQGLVAG